MAYTISFDGTDKSISAEQNETVLEAAIRAGLAVNYGCNNGNCGLCVARRLDGCVRQVSSSDYVFDRTQRDGQHFLMCSSTACSDLRIDALSNADSQSTLIQKITARVKSLSDEGDASLLRLRVSQSARLKFRAGQSAIIRHSEWGYGKYAIASCPCDALELEFYFRDQDDAFVEALRKKLKKGSKLQIEAPFGDFVFTEDMQKSIVFFAPGSGFSGVKSLIEHIVAKESELPITLYTTFDCDTYYGKLCRSWNEALDQFEYIKLDATSCGAQQFESHLTQQYSKDCDFYLSASQDAIAHLKEFLVKCGVEQERIFCQAVHASGAIDE